jgi:two-component system KDP operon response regulator KdpE
MTSENLTILVAEDDPDSREFLRFFLEGEGFNVIEAKNGAEAVELARQQCPDLVLTDLHMPELDGVAAINQIRSLCDVPILAISGDGQRGMELFLNIDESAPGYVHYLTKPLNLNELMEQITMLLPVMEHGTI